MTSFKELFTKLKVFDNIYDPNEYWQSDKDPSLFLCIAPPSTRTIKFSSHMDIGKFDLLNLPSPFQIYICKLAPLASGEYRFTIPYIFFLPQHPKKYKSIDNFNLYSPWYPNLDVYTTYLFDRKYLYQYNCLGPHSYSSLMLSYKKTSFSLSNKFLSKIISDYFKEFIEVYFSGNFNYDLGRTFSSNSNGPPLSRNDIWSKKYKDSKHMKWFDPSWKLKEVTKVRFIRQHAAPSFSFTHILNRFQDQTIRMQN